MDAAGYKPGRATAAVLIGLAMTAALGLLADGVYHEDDLKHFLYARWSAHAPQYLLEAWGRPGFTVLYAPLAVLGSPQTGWHLARLGSAALTAGTAWLAYQIARSWGIRAAWLAVVFVYAQPLLFRLSLTTLTETPLAFYFALATWLMLRGRCGWSAAVMALGAVTRHEAVVLWPIWGLALWRAKAKWWTYLLLGWAVLGHNLISGLWLGTWPVEVYLAPSGSTQYGQGTLLTYVPRLLQAAGPIVAALAVLGLRRVWRQPGGWIVVASSGMYFAAQTLVYMRGAYSSGGYARFLVPMAPWLAVLATAGATGLGASRLRIRSARWRALGACVLGLGVASWIEFAWRPAEVPNKWHWVPGVLMVLAAAALAVLGMAMVIAAGSRAVPRRFTAGRVMAVMVVTSQAGLWLWSARPMSLADQHRVMLAMGRRVAALRETHRPLLAVNYWLYYATGRWILPPNGSWSALLAEARPGTLFVWDERFCTEPDSAVGLDRLRRDPRWREVTCSRPCQGRKDPFLVVFECQASGPSEAIADETPKAAEKGRSPG